MLSVLKSLCQQHVFSALYTNRENTSNFMYGRVVCVNENNVAVCLISPEGCFDGLVIKQTCTVMRVEIDSQYDDKMYKLMKLNNTTFPEFFIDSENILKSSLLWAHNSKTIVSLEIADSGCDDVTGFIDEINDNICIIKQVDLSGYNDGITYVRLDDITQLSCGSQKEEQIFKLWQLNGNI